MITSNNSLNCIPKYKIKVFTCNEEGKILLTKEELEECLQQAYNDGYNDSQVYSPSITYRGNDNFDQVIYCNSTK